MSYHFVLEGNSLINQYLRRTGQEKYTKSPSQGKSSGKLWKFLHSLLSKGADIELSFGQPMDVFGHSVDAGGRSLDKYGNVIDISGYFRLDGELKTVAQREKVYTKLLGDKIVESYKKYNVVLSSHLVAFAMFRILLAKNSELNLYDVLNIPTSNFAVDQDLLDKVMKKMLGQLKQMEKKGKLKLSSTFELSQQEIIDDGIRHLGLYHPQKIVKKTKEGTYVADNFRLLYFYHNRLDSYSLEDSVKWTELIDIHKPILEKSIL